jgi:hypothetical protein
VYVIELLSFKHKLLLTGDLNAKHPFWNSVVFNPPGAKLLNSLHVNEFETSSPHCPTHYSPMGNGGVLDIVEHKNAQLSEVSFRHSGLRSPTSHFPLTGSC